jgi:predicted metal-binding membrane protein
LARFAYQEINMLAEVRKSETRFATTYAWLIWQCPRLSGGVLIAAGVYQLTPLKTACLARCRSPVQFLAANWRTGAKGAFRMGIKHGAFCLGCCLFLMLLLFVGGVMNIAWIAGLTVYVALEKLTKWGTQFARATAFGLIGLCLALLSAGP